MDKSPATATRAATSKSSQNKSTRIPTKHEQCLYALLKAGLKGINQLCALNLYGDTCLNTTISELGNKRGFSIAREKRPHVHQMGGTTSFSWYWFSDRKEATRALETINGLRRGRNCAPLSDREVWELLGQFPEAKGAA